MSAEWRADDAPAYPQTDEEAELLKLEAEGTRLVLAYADGEIDLDACGPVADQTTADRDRNRAGLGVVLPAVAALCQLWHPSRLA